MKILIVDDNHEFCLTIADIISTEGWSYHICNNPADAIDFVTKNDREIGVMLLDIEFHHPTLTGIEVLEFTAKNYPRIPVIMITGVGTIETAIKATKLGAMNFIEKSNIEQVKLKEVVYTAMEKVNVDAATEEAHRLAENYGIIGGSKKILEMADIILRYGRTELSVLITGETGTGKKLVANALHAASRRTDHQLVTVDIPNIPATLFQSELFGHLKGSFSGATEDKVGLFQQANKGTLFLDEIGDMPQELQANLLLPIEEKIVRRVGSVKAEQVDVRFVSATDRNLPEAIREGRFREQLYHRLRECEIHIPPLRERREDIPLIIEHYARKHNLLMQEQKFFTPSALEYLQELPWHGNVRELENLLKVTLQTSLGDRIDVSDLNQMSAPSTRMTESIDPVASLGGSDKTLRQDVDTLNRLKIHEALSSTRGNVSKASVALGISRETLHNRIKKYQIDVNKYRNKTR